MSFTSTAKNLGFHYADDMIIEAHVQDICRISSIRHLSIDSTKTLLRAFVLPKLDYCNYLFYGSPMHMLVALQKVHSSAARNLRSSFDNRILCIAKLRLKIFWNRLFSYAAPTIWNFLPSELRHTDSIQK